MHRPTRLVTLDEFILRGQNRFPGARGELSQLLRDIGLAGRIISQEVRRAGIVDILGYTGDRNVQGEEVKRLDQFADDTLVRILGESGHTCLLVSEENDSFLRTPHSSAKYVVFFDPLDGSSNIDVNSPIGTIFSVFRRVSHPADEPEMADCLQPGRLQVAAGYMLYGANTVLVYTTGMGVTQFVLDPHLGEFFLSDPEVRVPPDGRTFSANEANASGWPEPVREFAATFRNPPSPSRYIGSMVSDVHRTLVEGGVFAYPSDRKNPLGKLRLMYEANPMGFILEQAGGLALSGPDSILDIRPASLHERVPVYLGSAAPMRRLQAAFRTR